jgi:ATP-dependent exoDNAse (exonuclease V) beta subunit
LDDELDNEEKKRQLYVGMTRAEQRLILSGVCVIGSKRGKKAKEEWLESLQRILFEQG